MNKLLRNKHFKNVEDTSILKWGWGGGGGLNRSLKCEGGAEGGGVFDNLTRILFFFSD